MISVGDEVDIRYENGKILVEKLGDNWEKVLAETQGSWANHPVFGKMKNSVDIVHWLRAKGLTRAAATSSLFRQSTTV